MVRMMCNWASLKWTIEEISERNAERRCRPGRDEFTDLVRNSRPDWKAALASVKGIYTEVGTRRQHFGAK
jgi:hypothetical protein